MSMSHFQDLHALQSLALSPVQFDDKGVGAELYRSCQDGIHSAKQKIVYMIRIWITRKISSTQEAITFVVKRPTL